MLFVKKKRMRGTNMDYPLLENKLPKSIKKVWRNYGEKYK